MSTAKILGGQQYRTFKERRIGALKFYATMTRTAPLPVARELARVVHNRLLEIHRIPNRSNLEKDHDFREAIRLAAVAFKGVDGAADSAPAVAAPQEAANESDAGLPVGPGVPGTAPRDPSR